jgi:hypothetical protein
MKLKVSRTDTWAATLKDQPGSLADKLNALGKAGANLEFIIARRTPERSGGGVVFATPLKGAKVLKAAQAAGFQKSASLHTLRVEGRDEPRVAARIGQALAQAGLNLRGLSGAALGKNYVIHIALDSEADAAKAAKALKKLP